MKHISDIKKYERCEKLLWNAKKYPQPFLAFVYYGENINELALQKLGIDNYLKGEKGDDNNKFFDNKDKYQCFMGIRFEYHDLRVKVPLMIKEKEGYQLYFNYAACFPKEHEAQSIADTLWVLNGLNIKVNDVKIIHLNSEYVLKDSLNPNELLIISNHFYTDKNRKGSLINDAINKRSRDLDPVLNDIDNVLSMDNIEKERTNNCTKKNKCMFFDYCFPKTCDTSIFNLVSSAKKFDLYHAGKDTIDKIDFDEIEGTRHQFAQYCSAISGKTYFDYDAVSSFFESVSYPISYLDFEWETFAYPPYEGMKPYDVLTFQYSLHIEYDDGKLDHKEYLGKNDCRKEFIERLIEDIPKVGSIMCYNVEGAEKLRLRQLVELYPEYEDELRKIWERMIDLAIPFANGLIYDNRMAGMFSLKKLVEIFTDYNYSDLEISHGVEAVREYIRLCKQNEPNEELVDSLLKYCGMDTYAEYLIYHKIKDKLKENGYA